MAKKRILKNIKGSITAGQQNMLVSRIATFESESGQSLSLANFLNYHHLKLNTIYQKALFYRLCQKANLRKNFTLTEEERLRKTLLRIITYRAPLPAVFKTSGKEKNTGQVCLDRYFILASFR